MTDLTIRHRNEVESFVLKLPKYCPFGCFRIEGKVWSYVWKCVKCSTVMSQIHVSQITFSVIFFSPTYAIIRCRCEKMHYTSHQMDWWSQSELGDNPTWAELTLCLLTLAEVHSMKISFSNSLIHNAVSNRSVVEIKQWNHTSQPKFLISCPGTQNGTNSGKKIFHNQNIRKSFT